MSQPSRIVLDVTSFISAEEFIVSQNRGEAPQDPFARQCYAEVVQSLIFFEEVAVPHPILQDPRPDDYGAQPRMLQLLFDLGIVTPLAFSAADASKVASVEQALLEALETRGIALLHSFVDKTAICDRELQTRGTGQPMLQKIVAWSNFQDSKVRSAPDSHVMRIGTSDGIEADPFGDWARQSARSSESQLERLLPDQRYSSRSASRWRPQAPR